MNQQQFYQITHWQRETFPNATALSKLKHLAQEIIELEGEILDGKSTDMKDFEMPCLCDCGEWFDLNDGFADRNTNIIVCLKCHEKNHKIERLIDAYYDLECMDKPYKREKKKILKMLAELGAELNDPAPTR